MEKKENLRGSVQFPRLAHYESVAFINRSLAPTLLCTKVLLIQFALFSHPTVNLSVAKDEVTNAWITTIISVPLSVLTKISRQMKVALPLFNI